MSDGFRQQVRQELSRLADFYCINASIHDLCGDDSRVNLPHPVIWVLSPHEHYNRELVQNAEMLIKRQWYGLSPRFKTYNVACGYPPVFKDDCSQLWFFFFADRVDTQSELFKRWSDEHREIFRNMPPVLIKWYTKQQLASVGASIYDDKDDDESIAGHKCRIIPLETPDVLFESIEKNEINLLLEVLTLQAYRFVAPRESYKDYWHHLTTGFLEGLRTDLERTSKNSLSLNEALNTVFKMHRVMTRWDVLCKKVEVLKELPECEPGTSWDKKVVEAIKESTREAKDRIHWRSRRAANFFSGAGPNAHKPKYAEGFAEFQKLSDKISAFSEDLAQELNKRGETAKARYLEDRVKEGSASVQVILYGPFSSGKTTFVNTLLNLSHGNALPVKGIPTTSTFNLIDYGEKDSFEPSFHNTLEGMTLVKVDGKSRLRVHHAEIEAFLSWIDEEMLEKKKIRLKFLSRSRERSQRGEYVSVVDEKKLQGGIHSAPSLTSAGGFSFLRRI